jgi:hypothetical protein
LLEALKAQVGAVAGAGVLAPLAGLGLVMPAKKFQCLLYSAAWDAQKL